MNGLFARAKRVVWLDHHRSAFQMWCEGFSDGRELYFNDADPHYILLDNNKSGALLAWEYFHPGTEVPMLIRHIDDRDRWQWKLDGSAEFHAALGSYAPWSFEQWSVLLRETHTAYGGSTSYMTDFLNQGEAILRAHDQNVQGVVKGAAMKCALQRPDSTVHVGLAANCPPHLTSDVGHALANQSGTYGLLWCMDNDGRIKCSLRSNGDYDVSAIAKSFGGGGHKAASGFTIEPTTLLGWLIPNGER